MNDPLLAALAALREIDVEYVKAHPDTVDDEIARRMVELWLTVVALAELHDRGEDADADLMHEEMARLGNEQFAFDPNLLLELEAGFREDGDEVNADTLKQAAIWFAAKFAGGSAEQH
jgi:hypothetical protein